LLVAGIGSPEPSGAAGCGAAEQEASRAGSSQETLKTKKKGKEKKKSFYCIFVIHTNALLYIIFFIP